MWPTIAVTASRGAGSASCKTARHHLGTSLVDAVRSFHQGQTQASGGESRPSLNPVFTEWLMGWPEGWTAFEPVGMESWLSRARQHLLSWLGEQDSTS